MRSKKITGASKAKNYLYNLSIKSPTLIRLFSLYIWKFYWTKKTLQIMDGIATVHDLPFYRDTNFLKAKNFANSTSPFPYDIDLRLHQAIWCAKSAERNLKKNGVMVELGTGRGYVMAAVLEYLSLTWAIYPETYLFDTFEPWKIVNGAQDLSHGINSYYANGTREIEAHFSKFNAKNTVHIIAGEIPESLKELLSSESEIAFLHVDLNSPRVEVESLKLLWSKMLPGCVILLDDYAYIGFSESLQLFTEFFAKLNLYVLTTATGQGIVIKP
jgi:hypothetical protein